MDGFTQGSSDARSSSPTIFSFGGPAKARRYADKIPVAIKNYESMLVYGNDVETILGRNEVGGDPFVGQPALSLHESKTEYVLSVKMVDIKPWTITVEVQKGVRLVTILEKKHRDYKVAPRGDLSLHYCHGSSRDLIHSEACTITTSRSLRFPTTADFDLVSAALHVDVLIVRIPKMVWKPTLPCDEMATTSFSTQLSDVVDTDDVVMPTNDEAETINAPTQPIDEADDPWA